MAPGFFSSLFGGRKKGEEAAETPPSEKSTLKAGEVSGWISSQFSSDIKDERKKFSSLSEDLLETVSDFEKNVESIRKKEFERGDRTYAAVNMIKDTWAKRALLSFSTYNASVESKKLSPESIDYDTFRNLYTSTVKLMNETNMVSKQKIVLRRYFDAESRKMASILQSLGQTLGGIESAVNGPSRLKSMSVVSGMLDRLSALEKEGKEVSSRISTLKSDKERKEKEAERLQSGLSAISSSSDWKRLDEISKREAEASERKDRIEAEVSARLGEMKRLFKIFGHESRSIGKDERMLLDEMSHSPLKAFLSYGAPRVTAVIGKLNEDIKSGTLKLSEKDASKASTAADVCCSGWLSEAEERHKKALSDLKDAAEQSAGIRVAAEKNQAERLLENAKDEAAMIARELSTAEAKAKENESLLREQKAKISSYISKELGREAQIR